MYRYELENLKLVLISNYWREGGLCWRCVNVKIIPVCFLLIVFGKKSMRYLTLLMNLPEGVRPGNSGKMCNTNNGKDNFTNYLFRIQSIFRVVV